MRHEYTKGQKQGLNETCVSTQDIKTEFSKEIEFLGRHQTKVTLETTNNQTT